MRPPTLLSLLLVLLPARAFAQSASSLGDPSTGEMPPTVHVAAGRTATTPPPTGVDPEILALRAESGDTAEPIRVELPPPRASSTTWRMEQRDYAPAPMREGPSFGASLGHAWAGFGIGVASGGTLGSIIGAPLGGVLGAMILAPFGAAVLAPIGAALGVWGWGEQAGGSGNFFAALGLGYAGAGVGVAAGFLLGMANEGGWGAGVGPVLGAILSTLGAAIGYELTDRGSPEPRTATNRGVQLLLPTLAPAEQGDGGTVGVLGTF